MISSFIICSWNYYVCIHINNGDDRLAIFNLLMQEKDVVEAEICSELVWEEKPEKKNSHIILRNPEFDPKDKSCWPNAHQWMLEKLEIFREVFGSRIKAMDVGDWQPEDLEEDEG